MNLLNLPYLVQRHILKQMTYAELFFLSFTSKKMTTLISNIGWGEIKCIRYEASKDDYIEISALFKNGDIVKIFRAFSNKSVKEKHVKKLVLNTRGISCGVFQYDEMYNEPVHPTHSLHGFLQSVQNVFSPNLGFPIFPLPGQDFFSSMIALQHYREALKITSWPHLAIFSDQFNEDPAVEVIHNRIDRLFGKDVKYELRTQSEIKENVFLPKFIKFNRTNTYFDMIDVETNFFEGYFQRQPIQEHFSIGETTLAGRFNPNSKFFDTDTLVINKATCYNTVSDILCNFRGRSAHLWKAKCTDNMITQFLKNWKTGEHSQNIKSLRIQCVDRFSSPNRIKQETEIKEMTLFNKLPVVDYYDSYSYDDFYLTKKPTPRTISSYITRKDGIVAYVDVTEDGVVFEVQEFTEKQMLEANNGSV